MECRLRLACRPEKRLPRLGGQIRCTVGEGATTRRIYACFRIGTHLRYAGIRGSVNKAVIKRQQLNRKPVPDFDPCECIICCIHNIKQKISLVYGDQSPWESALDSSVPACYDKFECAISYYIRTLAEITREFGRDVLDLTTRQQVQLRWIRADTVPQVLSRLKQAGLTTLQTGFDNVRNITTCPAGVEQNRRRLPSRSHRSASAKNRWDGLCGIERPGWQANIGAGGRAGAAGRGIRQRRIAADARAKRFAAQCAVRKTGCNACGAAASRAFSRAVSFSAGTDGLRGQYILHVFAYRHQSAGTGAGALSGRNAQGGRVAKDRCAGDPCFRLHEQLRQPLGRADRPDRKKIKNDAGVPLPIIS